MVSNIVVGTLTTLNSIVSPLGPSTVPITAQVFRYQLASNAEIGHECRIDSTKVFSQLNLRFSDDTDGALAAHVTGVFCGADRQGHRINTSFPLPNEILDEDFLTSLPVGRPYVLAAGSRAKVKVTHLKSEGELQPFLVDWIPSSAHESSPHGLLTFWLAAPPASTGHASKTAASATKANSKNSPGHQSQAAHLKLANPLHWNRISISYAHPLSGDQLAMTGEYSGRDLAPKSRAR
jgi:hypothetical protein